MRVYTHEFCTFGPITLPSERVTLSRGTSGDNPCLFMEHTAEHGGACVVLTLEDVQALQTLELLCPIVEPGQRLYEGLPFHTGARWSLLTEKEREFWRTSAKNLGILPTPRK